MNLDIVREELKKHLNARVQIKVFGMRNKTSTYEGMINAIYPNIFTVIGSNFEKSFTFSDLITGEISIKYL